MAETVVMVYGTPTTNGHLDAIYAASNKYGRAPVLFKECSVKDYVKAVDSHKSPMKFAMLPVSDMSMLRNKRKAVAAIEAAKGYEKTPIVVCEDDGSGRVTCGGSLRDKLNVYYM